AQQGNRAASSCRRPLPEMTWQTLETYRTAEADAESGLATEPPACRRTSRTPVAGHPGNRRASRLRGRGPLERRARGTPTAATGGGGSVHRVRLETGGRHGDLVGRGVGCRAP